MLVFDIANMSCGHCVRAITEAVHEADPQAQVDADLERRQVHIVTQAPREQLVSVLKEAGYAPA